MMQQGRHDDGTATGQYNFKYNNYNGNYGQNNIDNAEQVEDQGVVREASVPRRKTKSFFMRLRRPPPNLEKQVSKTVLFPSLVFYVPVWIPKKPKVNTTFQN